jgi:parallel beta-helix repeat protein
MTRRAVAVGDADMKEFGAFVVAVSILLAASAPGTADVITVDGGGGGDYLTIQEAVDAAAWSGDTVLVYPGTYTDTHDCWIYDYPVNVCIYQSLTLRSLSGPDSTVIGGGSHAAFGVLAGAGGPVVVEGFTVTGGSYGGVAAICVTNGEVRGNACAGFGAGIINDSWWYLSDASERSEARDTAIVIADNIVEGDETGIHVRSWSGSDVLVSGNNVSGSQFAGIDVYGTGDVSLVGNDVSGNTRGIRIQNPSYTAGAHFLVELLGNRVVDNTNVNIKIRMYDIESGSECITTIGGSLEGANDIYGAPINLYAAAHNVDLYLDATYNFWGSVACSTIVPLFDIQEDVPDSAFIFEPFLDETHTITYDCQGVPVQNKTWGSIKSLYR